MITYPVLKGEHVDEAAPVEDDVEDHHDQQGKVEGRNGRCGMEVSSECDEHPGGKYQNPRYAAQGDSH